MGDRNVIVFTQTGNRCVVRAMSPADINEEITRRPPRGSVMVLERQAGRTRTVALATG